MSISQIITQGIGPPAGPSNIEYFLTLGLEVPAPAPDWRIYTPANEIWAYAAPDESTEYEPGGSESWTWGSISVSMISNKIPLEDGSGYLLLEDGSGQPLYEWIAVASPSKTSTAAALGRIYTPPERTN